MNEDTKTTATCKWCGTSLSPVHTGTCPKCGKEGKKIVCKIKEPDIKLSLDFKGRLEFYKKNPKILCLNIAIIIIASLLGWVVSGLAGVVIGIIIGIVSLCLLPPFVTKIIREI